MKLVEKKLSIAKEIGLKAKPAAPASKPAAKSAAMKKTEKSLETIGTEFVNIGMYVGGRRFLKIWALVSLAFALAAWAWTMPDNFVFAHNPYLLLGDRLYFGLVGAVISIPKLFAMTFIPMMLLVIAAHYVFVYWKLPTAARSKMSPIVRRSLIGGVAVGAIVGILFVLMAAKVVPSAALASITYGTALAMAAYATAGVFVISTAALSLYKEFTFMLGSKD